MNVATMAPKAAPTPSVRHFTSSFESRGAMVPTPATTADLKNESMETLLETAAQVVSETCAMSSVFNGKGHENDYPKFTDREVVAGKIIGRGGFCVVRNVDKIRLRVRGMSSRSMGDDSSAGGSTSIHSAYSATPTSSCLPWLCGKGSDAVIDMDISERSRGNAKVVLDNMSDERFSREYVAAQSRKKTRHGTRYVLKSVSKEGVSKITYMKGAVDIAMEAKFLSNLDHPNIIDLIATSKAKPCSPGFFLILERMAETLTSRIKKWMDKDRMNKGVISIFKSGLKGEMELYGEQIAASYDIANALQYLHSKNIIFRDLKPDNIGFDTRNGLKLFDFGLAKELLDKDRGEDGLYRNLTGCTGAIRYMAPEVGLGQPYNLTADAYSWSMLMWFMLALEPPFGLYSNRMIVDRVFQRGSRPAIFKRWNPMIADLLKKCWHSDMSERPSFLEISLCLKQELIECEAATSNSSVAAGGTTVSYHGSTSPEHDHRHHDDYDGDAGQG